MAWLKGFFWFARRMPRVPRMTRWFFVGGAWRNSEVLRGNLLWNARRLIGPDCTPKQGEAFARAVIGNFYDFICDVGASVGSSRARLLRRIERIDGHERWLAARADRRGAIVVTAHMGSFEVGLAALLQYESRLHVVFRRDPFGMFEKSRAELRQRLGVIEACVDDGLRTWVRLREALEADEVVLIQGDRVLPGQKGAPMPFLNGHMLLPTGPVKLAQASGAPIVPVFSIRRPDDRLRVIVDEPIRIQQLGPDATMARLAAVIERYVREYPEQWLMIHRPWIEDMEQTKANDGPRSERVSV